MTDKEIYLAAQAVVKTHGGGAALHAYASGEPALFDDVDFCDCFDLIVGAGVRYRWWPQRRVQHGLDEMDRCTL